MREQDMQPRIDSIAPSSSEARNTIPTKSKAPKKIKYIWFGGLITIIFGVAYAVFAVAPNYVQNRDFIYVTSIVVGLAFCSLFYLVRTILIRLYGPW